MRRVSFFFSSFARQHNVTTLWKLFEGPGNERIPAAQLDGGSAGPHWLITAGVHGDEYEGPEAIRRAVATLAGEKFPGRVTAIPVMNPMAYRAGRRCTPADNGNLNRLFPGRADGTITQQWAAWLWREFVSKANRLMDHHAGGATWAFEPVAGFYRDEDKPMAAAYGITLWKAPETPGVFSCEFRRHRGHAIGMELGYGGVRDEAMTARAASAIISLVRGKEHTPLGPVFGHEDILAPASGEWTASRSITQHVNVGDTLGVIRDWTGATLAEVKSRFSGRVLAVRRLVSVEKGELVVVVGPPLT